VSVDPVQEQVRLYAKQLKLPTFVRYPDILRKGRPEARFEELLLELMKAETEQRQENQNRKRLSFHTQKHWKGWTCPAMAEVSPTCLSTNLPAASLSQRKRTWS
jgi:hypothetical protein